MQEERLASLWPQVRGEGGAQRRGGDPAPDGGDFRDRRLRQALLLVRVHRTTQGALHAENRARQV